VDRESVLWLYERLSRRLLIFFTRRTCDGELALDLVAETFARALAGVDRFHGRSDGEAIAWVWGIARNLLAEYFKRGRIEQRALRRLGVERTALSDDEVARIEELAGLHDMRVAVAGALATLADDQREALRLRVVEELDYPAVASRLGVSEPTARARVSRGLRKLAEALDGSAVETA
jgi:RNA polymerase sigma factor (sigma-70 family)